MRKLKNEIRIELLAARGKDNQRIIAKLKRQLRKMGAQYNSITTGFEPEDRGA